MTVYRLNKWNAVHILDPVRKKKSLNIVKILSYTFKSSYILHPLFFSFCKSSLIIFLKRVELKEYFDIYTKYIYLVKGREWILSWASSAHDRCRHRKVSLKPNFQKKDIFNFFGSSLNIINSNYEKIRKLKKKIL